MTKYNRNSKSLKLGLLLTIMILAFLSCNQEKSQSIIPLPPNCNLSKSSMTDHYTLNTVSIPPQFKNTPKNLSNIEKKDYLSKGISNFIKDNYTTDTTINLNLTGKHRIDVGFSIDELGFIKDIEIKVSHFLLEKETRRVLEKLPQFIPAKHNGKNVAINYTLPIIFHVQD